MAHGIAQAVKEAKVLSHEDQELGLVSRIVAEHDALISGESKLAPKEFVVLDQLFAHAFKDPQVEKSFLARHMRPFWEQALSLQVRYDGELPLDLRPQKRIANFSLLFGLYCYDEFVHTKQRPYLHKALTHWNFLSVKHVTTNAILALSDASRDFDAMQVLQLLNNVSQRHPVVGQHLLWHLYCAIIFCRLREKNVPGATCALQAALNALHQAEKDIVKVSGLTPDMHNYQQLSQHDSIPDSFLDSNFRPELMFPVDSDGIRTVMRFLVNAPAFVRLPVNMPPPCSRHFVVSPKSCDTPLRRKRKAGELTTPPKHSEKPPDGLEGKRQKRLSFQLFSKVPLSPRDKEKGKAEKGEESLSQPSSSKKP